MGAPERGNDLDPRQDEIRMGEDGGRVEPLQTRFAEYVDLLFIDGEVCRDTVPTPPWVATTESNGVSSNQVGVDGAAPDDQERCAWSRAEPDPGEIFIRHDRNLPGGGDEPDGLGGQSPIRS